MKALTATWERPVMPVEFAPRGRRGYKLPREVRAQLYQLLLTVSETQHEMRRILAEHGIVEKANRCYHLKVIRRNRG